MQRIERIIINDHNHYKDLANLIDDEKKKQKSQSVEEGEYMDENIREDKNEEGLQYFSE